MATTLSQKEIGKRIMELRKAKGLSQDDLAKNIGISRSSLVQVELGNRYVDVLELYKLSLLLEFSLDEFLSKDFGQSKKEELVNEKKAKEKKEERIAVPEMSVPKFKNILLYILEKCAGKPNVGETVLYKLLYFADFNYYEMYEEHLSGSRYRKLPYGPVPKRFESIVNSMIEKEELKKIKTEYYNKIQTRYIPLIKPDLTKLKASEKEVIDRVIEQMSDWSAATISNYSHNDMPWKASKEGDEISYELAFYRRPPYAVRTYNEDEES
ncbi:type II toxin-antitoxin system antitoxin SocA domain-containing protein [Terrimonas pollutisoli]|uniref:type II toxin-antitoxin system antitoxin SocA domain-containing protein n=1 Tax=Terrimonas pollutisoli TaxID=3034147 RepID=UPI0023EAFB76|nr:type II toxin-antitoxin system antitoxin SocA domain-containing protein [Terrimonas sp. H1YJ31]